MANPILIFSGSNGLNVKVDPARLKYDKESGVQDLAVALNVDHDETGRVSRRKGFAPTVRTEDTHSLFCQDGPCLFVQDTKLCILNPDYTKTELATVTAGRKMRYCEVADRLYYANGTEIGYVKDGAANDWQVGTYYGPETTRTFTGPPVGTRVASHNGYMFVIQGSIAWHSEPFGPDLWDLARSFLPFATNIRMFYPLVGGIYVSTERATYWLQGDIPQEMVRRTVATYPVIEDTEAPVDMSKIMPERTGVGLMWTAAEGICLGLPTGEMFNLTERKLVYPSSIRGAGLTLDDRYIALLEP